MIRHTSTQRPNDLFFHYPVTCFRELLQNQQTHTDRPPRAIIFLIHTAENVRIFPSLVKTCYHKERIFPCNSLCTLTNQHHQQQQRAIPILEKRNFSSRREHLFFPAPATRKNHAQTHRSMSLSLALSPGRSVSLSSSRATPIASERAHLPMHNYSGKRASRCLILHQGGQQQEQQPTYWAFREFFASHFFTEPWEEPDRAALDGKGFFLRATDDDDGREKFGFSFDTGLLAVLWWLRWLVGRIRTFVWSFVNQKDRINGFCRRTWKFKWVICLKFGT